MKISIYNWLRLSIGLRRRGKGIRESGAFLITKKGSNRITKIVFYDDLDPEAFTSGIIRFEGKYYNDLNKILLKYGGLVVADIHTHPIGCSTHQSVSDQMHPMCRIRGHMAFIAPNYAIKRTLLPKECAAYLYEGDFKWKPLLTNEFPLRLSIL